MKLISYYKCKKCGKLFVYKHNNDDDLPKYIFCTECHSSDLIKIADLYIFDKSLWVEFLINKVLVEGIKLKEFLEHYMKE